MNINVGQRHLKKAGKAFFHNLLDLKPVAARRFESSAQLQLFDARESADRWTVRVSHRARRLSVRVYPGGRVEVVAPPGASAATVQRFVGTHRQWIDRRIEDLSTANGAMADLRPNAIDLPAIGRRYVVRYEADRSGAVTLDCDELECVLTVRGAVHDEQLVAAALRDWLVRRAVQALGQELTMTAIRGGFQFRRMQVRRQRTRWGSCSASGTISLNVCVLFLEPSVMRYLLIHELAHTKHMNHSKRFWSVVESHESDYRRLDRELVGGWRRVPGWVFA
jgi:predicted metal-dependent hydrolase